MAAALLTACQGGGSPASRAASAPPTSSPPTTPSAAPAATPPNGTSPVPDAAPASPPTSAPAPADPFALARSLRYATPGALAAALAGAETAIRAGTAPASSITGLGRAEDAAYRQLVDQPEWRPAVLASVPASLRPAVQANIDAGEELKALANPRDQLPAWRILTPQPEAELRADDGEAQRLSGIPWQYLAAINLVESRMGRIHGLSSGGAQGPMQFMPSTWVHYGTGDIDNAHDAILAAGRFLAAHGGPTDMAGALYAYNPSPHYVRAVTLYAKQLQAEPRALDGYYTWQVYFRTLTHGEALLVEGYGS